MTEQAPRKKLRVRQLDGRIIHKVIIDPPDYTGRGPTLRIHCVGGLVFSFQPVINHSPSAETFMWREGKDGLLHEEVIEGDHFVPAT